MRRIVSLLILLGANHDSWAHRLDECLQATRVKLATNQVELSIEVTPGVTIVKEFLAAVDGDHDGTISHAEGRAYGRKVLKELTAELDERPLKLSLLEISSSPVAEMKQGTGVVRIKAGASFKPLYRGRHQLSLTNRHLTAISVYLVNAVKPSDTAITISKQTRNERQQDYRLDFEVKPGS